MTNIYNLSIDSSNLGEYFSRAIIIPQIHFEESIKDLQSIHPNHLMFTNKKFTEISDCCIEIILTEDEISKLEKRDNLNFLETGIPITRVSKIFFYSREKMERTIDLARSSSFIPERLIHVIDKEDYLFLNEIPTPINFTSPDSDSEIKEKINLFNKHLGGFAFMKFGGDNYTNYSQNYFTTLDYFNSKIGDEIKPVKSKLNLDIKYHGLFDNKEKSWKDLHTHIFGLSQSVISFIGDKIPSKNNRYQLDLVQNNKILYIYGILANYGPEQFKPSTTDSLFQAILSDRINYREAVTLFFGIHNGYKSFRNIYTLNNTRQNLKFQLESKLDYYTIESIYQYTFNSKKGKTFDYLNTIIPINTEKINTKKYHTYQILDQHVIYKTKPESIKEIIFNYLKKTRFSKIMESFRNDFEKKNNIEFTNQQSTKFDNDLYEIIKSPIQSHLEGLEKEIQNFITISTLDYEYKIKQLKQSLEESKTRHSELSIMLKTTDKNLFDEIDTNRNGILDTDEIIMFLDKMKKAKLHLKELNEKPFIDEITQSNQISKKLPEQSIIESQNNDIELHKYYLIKLNPTQVTKEVKKHNISITDKINKDNKLVYIEKIIEVLINSKTLM